MQRPVEHSHSITLLDLELVCEGHVLFEDDRRDATRALEPQTFTNDQVQVVKIEAVVNSDKLLHLLSFGLR